MHSTEKLHHYLEGLIQNKSVAILGFGREGQSTYRTLRKFFPTLPIMVLDKSETFDPEVQIILSKDPHVRTFLGGEYLSDVVHYDVIFKTPGIPLLLLPIQDAVNRGAYVTSQTDVFFHVFGNQTVAVTGTKGKSTTSKVISDVLRHAHKKSIYIGNIGKPAFDSLDDIDQDTIVVYETSSHQCEGLRVGPHIAVFLNLFTDHLDYYGSFDAYATAKRQLFLLQKETNMCIHNCSDERVNEYIADTPPRKIGFSLEKRTDSSVWIQNDQVRAFDTDIINTHEIPLLGKHNILNIMPAIIIAHELGVPFTEISEGLKTITPVEKRLETVAVVDDVTYVDDALATIPEATIAALEALGSSVETLIVGGFDRGQDFTDLARAIASSSVRTLIHFPTTGSKIASLVSQHSQTIAMHEVQTMGEAINIAKQNTHPGKTVLLSTGSASFGIFTDYRDRSNQYLRAITQAEV